MVTVNSGMVAVKSAEQEESDKLREEYLAKGGKVTELPAFEPQLDGYYPATTETIRKGNMGGV